MTPSSLSPSSSVERPMERKRMRKTNPSTSSSVLPTAAFLVLFACFCIGSWSVASAFTTTTTPTSFSRLQHGRRLCLRPTATPPSHPFMSSSDDDSSSSSFDLKSLQSRMAQLEDSATKLPIVVLDSMLPRQVLKIEVENDIFQALIKDLTERERKPVFGMIGVATLVGGPTIPLQNGVEVELVDAPLVVDAPNNPAIPNSNNKALRVKLRAGRRFRINQNELETNPGGWTEARVVFLGKEGAYNSKNENDDDVEDEDDDDEEDDDNVMGSPEEPEDPVSFAKAVKQATQLTSQKLVEEWIALARTKQHFDGQIDTLLEDLGKMPSPTAPSDLAFWIGALINPLPGMGVAMEIRPQLLMSKTAEERVGIVWKGLEDSIAHMKGTKRMF